MELTRHAVRTGTGPDLLAPLLARTAQGDRPAFAALYDETAPKLFPVALRILSDRTRAEDVLQDCFVTVWERASDYDPLRGSVLTWMGMIVRNRAIDARRRSKARGEDRTVSEESLYDHAAGPDSAADRGAGLAALNSCLDELAEDPRRAVWLAYAYGYTHEELAERMGTPMGTIKSWIRRSLERLKRCLEG